MGNVPSDVVPPDEGEGNGQQGGALFEVGEKSVGGGEVAGDVVGGNEPRHPGGLYGPGSPVWGWAVDLEGDDVAPLGSNDD